MESQNVCICLVHEFPVGGSVFIITGSENKAQMNGG